MARYIDDCHTAIGGSVYHIREYASYLEQIGGKAIPIRPGLPEKCYAVLPSGDEIITVRHGEAGYYHTDKYGHDRAHVQAIVDEYNAQINVTKAQAAAMLAGSLFGWETSLFSSVFGSILTADRMVEPKMSTISPASSIVAGRFRYVWNSSNVITLTSTPNIPKTIRKNKL